MGLYNAHNGRTAAAYLNRRTLLRCGRRSAPKVFGRFGAELCIEFDLDTPDRCRADRNIEEDVRVEERLRQCTYVGTRVRLLGCSWDLDSAERAQYTEPRRHDLSGSATYTRYDLLPAAKTRQLSVRRLAS